MQETAVDEYSYDQRGQLRAEWDPRVSPALKTTYGYDKEGHVTALTAPGQESWTFTYGPIAGDAGTGRLLKAMQASASTELWKGEAVASTESPKITGGATEGVRLAVSNGKWSGSPTAYGYQWEDCNSAGEACKPILGATDANYTPAAGDVGDKIMAVVTATNGDGSVTATSGATAVVQTMSSQVAGYSLPSESDPLGIAAGPDGNLWYADFASSKIGKITTSGTITEYALPKGSYPKGIVEGYDGNMWYTDYLTNKIGKITTSGTITEYALPSGSSVTAIAAGPDGKQWFTDSASNKIGKITTSVTITEYALPAGIQPEGITEGPLDGKLWFTDFGTNKIGKITTSGAITEYALPAGSRPVGITADSYGNLWYTDDYSNKIGKIKKLGVITEY
jgi:streptogramin lyase